MLPVDSDTLWGFCTPSRLAIPRNVFHSFVLKILCKTYQEIRTSKLNLARQAMGADFILLRITDTSDLRFINFRRLLPITALRRLKQLVFCLTARSLRRSGAPMMR